MRTEEEVRKALEFWKETPTSTKDPHPYEVLVKGIVAALDWVLGADAAELAAKLSREDWVETTAKEEGFREGVQQALREVREEP